MRSVAARGKRQEASYRPAKARPEVRELPLDPVLATLLQQMQAMGGRALSELEPAQARAQSELLARFAPPPPEVASVQDITAAGLPARLYRPTREAGLPLIVYFHGGGFVMGSVADSDPLCRSLANASGCAVLSVEYRLAPEHKFPAAVEDACAATAWAASHAPGLGCDAARLAVAGDSAGGNLAAVTALHARDRGAPAIARQLLIYPATDMAGEYASVAEHGEGLLLTRADMAWFGGHYLRGEADRADPRASPLRWGSHAGLPPAMIVTAEYDPLRDEGEAYAQRLRAAGVEVDLRRAAGMTHGFWTLAPFVPAAAALMEQDARDFGRALRGYQRTEA
jgi:acetyl esterase